MLKEDIRKWLLDSHWLVIFDKELKPPIREGVSYLVALSPIGVSVTFYFDKDGKLLNYVNYVSAMPQGKEVKKMTENKPYWHSFIHR